MGCTTPSCSTYSKKSACTASASPNVSADTRCFSGENNKATV